ncbi:MAG: hypothetical protein MUQ32_03080 [Chloroflexi bacterium]|nr:hypothetical protein [Chloroflexota bacterium]
MTSFAFVRSPAFVTIGEGLRIAARYWRSSAERWVLPVLAVALVNGLASWVFGAAALDQASLQALLVPGSDGPGMDASGLPPLLAGPLAIGLVTVAAEWFLVANAIAGLRGREISLRWVLTAGLRAFVADMVVASGVVMLVLTALTLGAAGLLVLLLLLPALLYLGVRLQFWTLAIFDGAGISDGLRATWTITRGGVLRVFGWGLAMAGLGLVVSAFSWVLDLVLAGAPTVVSALGAAAGSTLQAFTAIVLAVLYESQRLRGLPRVVEPEPYRSPRDPPPPPPPYQPPGGPPR